MPHNADGIYVEARWPTIMDPFRDRLWDLLEGEEALDESGTWGSLRQLLQAENGPHACSRLGCRHSAWDHRLGATCRHSGCSCPAWTPQVFHAYQEGAWGFAGEERCRSVYDDAEDRSLTQCRLTKNHAGHHQAEFDFRQRVWPAEDARATEYR